MTAGPPDDRSLVDRVLASGDERAFAVLYDRHTPYLYGLALRLTGGDPAAADELTHEAWVRAARRLAGFAGSSPLRTWIAGFVVRCAFEAARQSGREASLVELSAGAEDPVTAATCDRVDLERALAGLAPGFRTVLVLHDVEGYTHEEIAALLGIEPGTSKSQLSRARAAVRRMLEPNRDGRKDAR